VEQTLEEVILDAIHPRVAAHRDAMISFLRDIVAIPTYDGNIRKVARFR